MNKHIVLFCTILACTHAGASTPAAVLQCSNASTSPDGAFEIFQLNRDEGTNSYSLTKTTTLEEILASNLDCTFKGLHSKRPVQCSADHRPRDGALTEITLKRLDHSNFNMTLKNTHFNWNLGREVTYTENLFTAYFCQAFYQPTPIEPTLGLKISFFSLGNGTKGKTPARRIIMEGIKTGMITNHVDKYWGMEGELTSCIEFRNEHSEARVTESFNALVASYPHNIKISPLENGEDCSSYK